MDFMTRINTGLKREKNSSFWSKTGWVIIILTLLTAINSTIVFLFVLKAGIIGWIMLNTCAITIFGFVTGYIFKLPGVMAIFTVPLIRYGFAGLFVFNWSGTNVFSQAGHVMMTISALYYAYFVYREKTYRTLVIGLILGIIMVTIFEKVFHQPWISINQDIFKALFDGELTPKK